MDHLLENRQVDTALLLADHQLIARVAEIERRQLYVGVQLDVAAIDLVADQEVQRLVDGRVLGHTAADLVRQSVGLEGGKK